MNALPTVCIERRFRGPPDSGNGGYCAGLLASFSPELLCVRLERPVPLETPLEVQALPDGRLQLLDAGRRIARAWPTTLELAVPRPPEYLEALEASRRYTGFTRHAFPDCFVCGPDRSREDGLRVFAGAVPGRSLVAAPWVPDRSLADGKGASADPGKVRPEYMCAALDCPGYFAAHEGAEPLLLGEFTAHLDRCVHIDEPCVVIGWSIRSEGRRFEVGTALFDEDGELCARARALWIAPRRAAAGGGSPA